MKPWLSFTCGIAAFAVAAPAFAQQSDVVIPSSSVFRPEDAGKRAHTNFLIYTGPAQTPGQAPPLAEVNGPKMFTPAGISPAQLKTAYSYPPFGGGSAIAVILAYDYPTALNDFNVFSNQYGLLTEPSPNPTLIFNRYFQVVYANGKPAGNLGWNEEAALDMEWSHAMAPNAKIFMVEALSNSYTDLFAAVAKAATLPNVKQISMSWGSGEFNGENSYDSNFSNAGIEYFVSSGDTGGVPEYPAMSPNVLQIGGETLHIDVNGNVTSESGWSGSGGGSSAYEPRPAFQNGIAGTVGSMRGGPDISAVADPATGVAVYISAFGWQVFGGTSVACPVLAGMTNFAEEAIGPWLGTAGLQNKIYSQTGAERWAITDITTGTAGAFHCTPGWDFVTGFGRPHTRGGL